MRILHIVFCLVFAGGAFAAEPGEKSPAAVMKQALQELLGRAKAEDPFVIFTDAATNCFVQYAIDDGVLYVDIPLIGKSEEEKKRLAQVFASVGVERPTLKTARDPKTKKPFTIQSYQVDFSQDATKAARFGLRLFREVFLIKEPSLKIETD